MLCGDSRRAFREGIEPSAKSVISHDSARAGFYSLKTAEFNLGVDKRASRHRRGARPLPVKMQSVLAFGFPLLPRGVARCVANGILDIRHLARRD